MSESQEKIQQLQTIEQSLQQMMKPRQQLQVQLMEITSAQEELKKTDKAYRIISNIMVAAEKAPLDKELTEKKVRVELRIKSIEKQENTLKEQAKTLREDIMKTMQKKQ
ncbi:MAG: prefoldin subunit [Candidatus Woesearchaeota archaeon]|jgi:prefoldin beta subunit